MVFLNIFSFILISSCSKPKTVFICGDHICVNKSEANAYFEENLTIETVTEDLKIKKEVTVLEISSIVLKNSKTNENVKPEAPVANKNKKFLRVSFESNKNVFP